MSNPEADLQIDSTLFYQKIDRIYSEWKVRFDNKLKDTIRDERY